MIDRWIYNFFAGLDRMCESIAKCMESKFKVNMVANAKNGKAISQVKRASGR